MGNGFGIPTFTPDEWDELDNASLRLARAFGYGSGWRSAIVHPSQAAMAEGEISRAELVNVGHRGHVTEQAARSTSWCKTSVRRQHAWTLHGGVVALPFSKPDPGDLAALSYAQLSKLEHHLLIAYALEDIQAWYCTENALEPISFNGRSGAIAWRDAMARIMYRFAATQIDDRAKQLCVKATDYRRATRRAEWILRANLIAAAKKYNNQKPYRSIPMGSSQGNALRTFSAWNEKERIKTRRMNEELIGTAPHPANDINLTELRKISQVSQPLPIAA